MEDTEVGQARFPLRKSTPTTPQLLLGLPWLGNAFGKDFLHCLPRKRGPAHQPLLSQILPLDLLQDTRGMSFLPAFRNCPHTPCPFQANGEWPPKDIRQRPQHSWLPPVKPRALVYIQSQSTPSCLPSSSSATSTARLTNGLQNTHLGSLGAGLAIHPPFGMQPPPPGPPLCSHVLRARLQLPSASSKSSFSPSGTVQRNGLTPRHSPQNNTPKALAHHLPCLPPPLPLCLSTHSRALQKLTCPCRLPHIQSESHGAWKRPLTVASPTVKQTVPSPPLKHVPERHIYTSLRYLPGWGLNHFPGQPGPVLDNTSHETIVPNTQSKLPLAHLEAVSSSPITSY